MLLSCILSSFYYHVYLTVSCYDVYLASLAKWLSVCLRTKWLSVRIAFLSLKYPGTQIATKYYKYCGIQRQLGDLTQNARSKMFVSLQIYPGMTVCCYHVSCPVFIIMYI